jgi:membrane protein DedA with SNARE-associated domain
MNFELLIPYFSSYGILISFLAGFIFGVESIMTLAFLGTNSALSYVVLFIFGLFGLVLSDSIYFSLGKYKLFKKITDKYSNNISNKVDRVIHHHTKKNLFLIMFYTKVAYGVSIITLIYFGSKDISWKRFLKTNLIVNIIWVLVGITLGWSSGNGYKIISKDFGSIELALTIIFLFIFVIIILKRIINKKIEDELK